MTIVKWGSEQLAIEHYAGLPGNCGRVINSWQSFVLLLVPLQPNLTSIYVFDLQTNKQNVSKRYKSRLPYL